MSRQSSSSRRAFTSVELIIVCVSFVLVSSAVMSALSAAPEDPRRQILQHNLGTIRAQIEHYKLEHGGAPPQWVDGALPQLTSSTDAEGRMGPAGEKYPLGPYLPNGLPVNPLDGRSAVAPAAGYPFAAALPGGGWLYDSATGHIAANTPGYLGE